MCSMSDHAPKQWHVAAPENGTSCVYAATPDTIVRVRLSAALALRGRRDAISITQHTFTLK